MPLSVTCQCGAHLEIDDKFLGKEIPCPDCGRPLPTAAPAIPPPLDLPDHRRTSGLAALSLTLALVGAFTVVGTIAAIAVGLFAMRQIARHPTRLEGLHLARAGIALGGAFTFITLAALISPTVFGLDIFLRELAMVNRVEYQGKDIIETANGNIQIDKKDLHGLWGKYTPPSKGRLQNTLIDALILVNVADDAYLACQSAEMKGGEKIEEIEKTVLEHFYKSDLINLLGRLQGQPLGHEGVVSERKPAPNKNDWHEITVDLRLAGIDRRFLIRYVTNPNLANLKSDMLVGCARRNRFDRLEDSFRKTFDKYQRKDN